MDKDIKSITGQIINYIFESQDSLYKVCEIETADSKVTIVGNFPHLDEGLSYQFFGYMKETKYGEQFYVESYQRSDNFTKSGLISYLSSDKFYGIGIRLATNIVEKLGLDAINKIIEDKSNLDDIKGLNQTKKDFLYEELKNNIQTEQVFIRLFSFGLTHKMVERIYNIYGLDSVNIIEENPYTLIYDVEGFGFKRCDRLALDLNFREDDIRRIKAAIVYTITTVCNEYGYTFLTISQLILSTKRLLGNNNILDELYNDAIDMLIRDKKLIKEDDRIYIGYLYNAECKVAERLIKINDTKIKGYSREKIEEALDYVEGKLELSYTPLQKEAIINSLLNKLSIITGGPGTGKSTILKGILYTYARLNNVSISDDTFEYNVLMVSPTGRASKRMVQTTGYKASTIHKALGYTQDGVFQHDELSPLSQKLIIIDEASMIDIVLLNNLLKALLNSVQIILVGDSNQLPSVGPGNVLFDLINSPIFKVTRLNQIMRQARDSDIISLSSMVLSQRIDYNIFNKKKEVFFYPFDAKGLVNGLFRIIDNFISKGGDLLTGIQILIPMYAGISGIDEVNKRIQEKYNLNTESIIRDDKFFKKNDKVLQLKNDTVLDVMNGDIGVIIDITKKDEKDVLLIKFDDRIVTYKASDLDNLSLAYAMSIHKSQGSEFDNVILPILPNYSIMLKRKLIYTAITRAKKKLIILGDLKTLDLAIHQLDLERQTTLTYRITNSVTEDLSNKILDPDIPFDTMGEYGMEGITPYTFMDE